MESSHSKIVSLIWNIADDVLRDVFRLSCNKKTFSASCCSDVEKVFPFFAKVLAVRRKGLNDSILLPALGAGGVSVIGFKKQ